MSQQTAFLLGELYTTQKFYKSFLHPHPNPQPKMKVLLQAKSS